MGLLNRPGESPPEIQAAFLNLAKKAVALSPVNYRVRGSYFLNRGEYEHALADLNQMVAWRGSVSDYTTFSSLHAEMGKFDAARQDLESAFTLATGAQAKDQQVAPPSVDRLNDLAWFLATTKNSALRDSKRAVVLAEKAVANASQQDPYPLWNTLAVARYRNEDWTGALDSLQKSMELRSGGDSFDWFFLAMTHWQLGQKDEAGTWYDKAVVWMEKNKSDDEQLQRFRAEAAALLGLPDASVQQPTEDPPPAASQGARPPAVPLPED